MQSLKLDMQLANFCHINAVGYIALHIYTVKWKMVLIVYDRIFACVFNFNF